MKNVTVKVKVKCEESKDTRKSQWHGSKQKNVLTNIFLNYNKRGTDLGNCSIRNRNIRKNNIFNSSINKIF